MQHYQCYICKQDPIGGGSMVYGGMFFKLCKDCLDDEQAMKEMNEYWRQLEEDNEVDIG